MGRKRAPYQGNRIQGPVFTIGGEPPGKRGSGRRWMAVIIPVALVAVVVGVSVLFLVGAVKLGTPSMSGISLASRVDSSGKPLDARTRFTAEDPDIYCCATVRAFGNTRLEARWFSSGLQVADFKGTFGRMAGSQSAKFMTSRGHIAFKLERPSAGWVTGPYSVKIFVDSKQAGARDFLVGEDQFAGMTGVRYADPASGFSILVPEGWLPAEKASLGGALAGFVAPAPQSAFPARYAVSLTDFTSADTGYLNEIVQKAGAKPGESFGQYAIGDLKGARRVFEWDYTSGNQQQRLRTIQVVMQVSDKVFSVDCHSLATEYAANEPVFNAVINSFR